jgi:DNA polymerase-4
VTEATLRELGVTTGKDLKQLSLERLQALFGKRGTMLYSFARGIDDRPVEPERERKSVGKETTFSSDIADLEEMLRILEHLTEQVAQRLAELGIAGQTITLKLRWRDFQLVTRSMSVSTPIQDARTMMRSLSPLLDQLLVESKPVRLLGVTLSHLVPCSGVSTHEQMVLPLWELEGE